MDKKEKRPTILFIDDDKNTLTSVRLYFNQYYDVCLASSTKEAYQILKKNGDISIIISDQRMPGETGVEFFKRIRLEYPKTFRMILTGYCDIDVIIDAINQGHVYYYFKKPMDVEEVKLVINSALDAMSLKKELSKKENQFQSIFQQAAVGIAYVSLSNSIIMVNHYFSTMFGYREDELLQMKFNDIISPVDLKNDRKIIKSLVEGKTRSFKNDRQFIKKDGNPIWVRVTTSIANGCDSDDCNNIVYVVEDISEEKNALENLRKSRIKYKGILEASADGMIVIDEHLTIVKVNKQLEHISGYSMMELVDKPMNILIPETYKTQHTFQHKNFKKKKIIHDHNESDANYIQHKDGHKIPVDISISSLETEDGTIVFAAIRDITERKEAEKKLETSRIRLKDAQKLAKLGNWELELETNELYWSEEVFNIFGINPQKIAPSYETFLSFIHPEDKKEVREAFEASLKTHTAYDLVHRIILKDGTIKYLHEKCQTDYDKEGIPRKSVGTVQDITEQKMAEEKIQKLNEELEQRVRERTKELELLNKSLTEEIKERKEAEHRLNMQKIELEQFNKSMVGREIRIIDLKKEVNELCNELGKKEKYPPIW